MQSGKIGSSRFSVGWALLCKDARTESHGFCKHHAHNAHKRTILTTLTKLTTLTITTKSSQSSVCSLQWSVQWRSRVCLSSPGRHRCPNPDRFRAAGASRKPGAARCAIVEPPFSQAPIFREEPEIETPLDGFEHPPTSIMNTSLDFYVVFSVEKSNC